MPKQQTPFLAGEQLVGGLRCSEVLALLSDFLDGELPPEVQARVQAHVAACNNCARFGASFQLMLHNSLAAGKEAVDPESAAEQTKRFLRERLKPSPGNDG